MSKPRYSKPRRFRHSDPRTATAEGGMRDSSPKKTAATVWLDAEVFYELRDAAAACGSSFSALAAKMIERGMQSDVVEG